MRDRDIRDVLRRELLAQHGKDPDTRIVEELGLCQGDVRVDVAVINGSLSGFEIKSDQDTLGRLPGQQRVYGMTLDYVTIVAHASHIDAVERVVPDWWGITEVTSGVGVGVGVALTIAREARQNPHVEPYAVAQLLWRDEVLSLLKARGTAAGLADKPRRVLWQTLAREVPATELGDLVRRQLKARSTWRSGERRRSGGDSFRSSATSSRSLGSVAPSHTC
jgi:hypothetical protein